MKKSLLVLSALMALSMAFVGCKGGASDPDISDPSGDVTPAENVVASGENGTFFKWADLGITAENASEYYVKVTYTLDDPAKAGWGPGALNDASWENNSLGDSLNVTAAGVNEIEVSDIIAVPALAEGFLVNWWGDYATLKKVEIIKKL